MQVRVVVVWTLILLGGWAVAFGIFATHFSGAQFEKLRADRLQKKLESTRHEFAFREIGFQKYKDAVVAAGIKVQQENGQSEEIRAIASVTSDPSFKQKLELPENQNLFLRGSQFFEQGAYDRAVPLLKQFIENFSDDPHTPKAGYLWAESLFRTRQFEECADAINFVVNHFPETLEAGFSLMILGQIYSEVERLEDAADIYRLVISKFPDTLVEEKAKAALKGLQL